MAVVGNAKLPNDPATTTAKKALNNAGIGDERMSFDNRTNSIQVDGRNILSTPRTNPFDQQVNTALQQYMQALQNPRTFTAQDAIGTPQYQAAQAQLQQQAQQATRQAQESLGGAGLGRSSVLTDRTQRIQNQANEYLQTQVLPQIIQQLQQQEMQRTQNLAAMLDALTRQQGLYDQRQNIAFEQAMQEAGLTGTYVPQAARPILDELLALKAEAERPGLSEAQYAAYRAEGDRLRNILRSLGVDPSFIGSDVTSTQAAQAIPSVFATQQARQQQIENQMRQQQMEYQAARDAIMDERWKQQFDEDVRRWGLEYALNKQIQQGQLDIARYNANTSRMNAETSRAEAQRRQADIDRAAGAQSFQADVVSGLTQFDNPEDARAWLNVNAAEITRQLGAEGFREMQNLINTIFGAPQQDQGQALRQQALNLAQRDPRWQYTNTDREALIQEYMNLIAGR